MRQLCRAKTHSFVLASKIHKKSNQLKVQIKEKFRQILSLVYNEHKFYFLLCLSL